MAPEQEGVETRNPGRPFHVEEPDLTDPDVHIERRSRGFIRDIPGGIPPVILSGTFRVEVPGKLILIMILALLVMLTCGAKEEIWELIRKIVDAIL